MADFQARTIRFVADTNGGKQEVSISRFANPKAAVFYTTEATADGVASGIRSSAWGLTDGTYQAVSASSDNRQETSTTSVIKVLDGATKLAEGVLKNFTNNGFVIDWVVTPAAAYIVEVQIYGGQDLQAHAGSASALPTSISGLPFQPELLYSTAVAIAGSFSEPKMSLGIVYDDGVSVENRCLAEDGNNVTIRDDGHLFIENDVGQVTSFTSDGWNQTDTGFTSSGSLNEFGYLALNLGGAAANLMTVDSPTSTGLQSITGAGHKPESAMILASQLTSLNTTGNRSNFVSLFDVYQEVSNGVYNDDSLADSKAVHVVDNSGTTLHEATFDSFDADGFTLNFSTADAVARKWVVLTFEEQPVVERLVSQPATMSGSGSVDSPVTVVESQVNSGSDDSEERVSDGDSDDSSSDLELNWDTASAIGSNYRQICGTRHTNVQVPQGAVIQAAWVQFTADEADSGFISIDVHMQDADDTNAFDNSNSDISGRPKTSATVNWKPPAWGTVGQAGADERTPDISALVKEVVDRPGWQPGNSMVAVFTPASDTVDDNHRTGESYNGSPSGAAVLHIEFNTLVSEGSLSSQPATLSATGKVSHTGSGTLSSQPATLNAVGSINFEVAGTAQLSSQSATLSATGEIAHTGSAVLSSQSATMSAEGTVPVSGLYDFEDGNPMDGGDTASFARVSGSGRDSSFSLDRNSTDDAAYKQVWDTSTNEASGPGFKWSGWVKTNSGFSTTGLTGLAFGIPTGASTQEGYQALIDVRSGEPDFQIREDRNFNDRTDSPLEGTIAADEWIYIEITWDAGVITAKFYADDAGGDPGTLLETLTRNDSTYTDGHVGVHGYSLSSFDNLLLGTGTTITGSASLSSQSATLAGTDSDIAGSGSLSSQPATLNASGIKVNQVLSLWSGALQSDSFKVNARMQEDSVDVRVVVSTNSDLSSPVFTSALQSVSTSNDKNISVKVTGLNADTQYYYGVTTDGKPDLNYVGECRTAPTSGTFKIAFSGDAPAGSNHIVFDRIVAEDPLVFFHMGDLHYEDINTNDVQLFRDAYNTNFGASKWANLAQKYPWNYVWDDHDYGGNDSDSTNPAKTAAAEAYRDMFPHYDLELSGNDAIYHSFSLGRIKFIFTDCRFYKSPKGDTDDASKTMLGTAQKTWLKNELADGKNNYALTVWFNSLPWISAQSSGADHWGGYTTERQEMADEVKSLGFDVNELVMISADMHALAFDDGSNSGYATGGGGAFTVLHGAPLDRVGSTKGGPYSEGVLEPAGGDGDQYVILTLIDNGTDPITWTASGKYQGSEVMSLTSGAVGSPAILSSQPATLDASGSVSGITGSGSLQSQSATLSAVGQHEITGSGVLQSQPATLSAIGALELSGSGSLSSQSATLSATGSLGHSGIGVLQSGSATLSATGSTGVTGSGVLQSQSATMNATGSVGHTGAGSLSSQPATLSATGQRVVAGSGSLSSQPATLSALGSIAHVGSAVLSSQEASLSAVGTKGVTGTGTLSSQSATLSAAGSVVHAGSGVLSSQPATLSAVGEISGTISGSAVLSSQSATLSAAGEISHVGTATLNSQPATLSAVGVREVTGIASLQSGAATISSQGSVEHVGSGSLQSQPATLSAVGSVATVGTASLQSQPATLSAVGERGSIGTATLVSQSATLSAVGAVGDSISGSGALSSQPATLSAVGVISHTGVGVLSSQPATLNAVGAVGHAGTSSLQSQPATLSALGAVGHVGQATLSSQSATLNAVGAVGTVGVALLQSQDATLNAVGSITSVGSGILNSQPATLNAVGTFIVSGSGILNSQPATISSVGEITHAGTASLNSQPATMSSVGEIFGSLGSGVLNSQPATLNAVGERIVTGLAVLNSQSATLIALGTHTGIQEDFTRNPDGCEENAKKALYYTFKKYFNGASKVFGSKIIDFHAVDIVMKRPQLSRHDLPKMFFEISDRTESRFGSRNGFKIYGIKQVNVYIMTYEVNRSRRLVDEISSQLVTVLYGAQKDLGDYGFKFGSINPPVDVRISSAQDKQVKFGSFELIYEDEHGFVSSTNNNQSGVNITGGVT